jgi:ADP-ribose pyrophosphatase YjhB (NUDIX family)
MAISQTDLHHENYTDAKPILVAVDNVIFGFDPIEEKLKVLAFRRQVAPKAGSWSLIGSFIKKDESAIAAAKRILEKFTGLHDVYLEQFKSYTSIDRDPGSRVISIAYFSLIRINEENEDLVKTYQARWFDLDLLPNLVADHNEMVSDALKIIQEKAIRQPIGFNLLPKHFTIPKLLQLYQEIYQTQIDDRNFRKKMLATNILERLTDKDKSASRKGAFLYQFNTEKYFELINKGITIHFM